MVDRFWTRSFGLLDRGLMVKLDGIEGYCKICGVEPSATQCCEGYRCTPTDSLHVPVYFLFTVRSELSPK